MKSYSLKFEEDLLNFPLVLRSCDHILSYIVQVVLLLVIWSLKTAASDVV